MGKKVIKNGLLVDGNGGEAKENQIVVVNEDKIEYVGEESSYSLTGNEEVIDAQGGTILPGLIDTHVHMMMEYMPVAKKLEMPFSLMYYNASKYLETTLHAGITAVRDAAGTDLGVKQAVEKGLITGPRLQISVNALTITGGHGDGYTVSTNDIETLPSGYPGMPSGICDGVEDVRKKTREILRAGADIIKVHATGGVVSATDHPEYTQFSPEELEVMAEEGAFRKGVKVMVPAHGAAGIKNAIRAGSHSIEHGIYLDDEAIELMLENGTYLVPTLLAPVAVLEQAEESDTMPAYAVEKARESVEAHRESVSKAYEAGVKIVMGTDAGVMPHGTNLRELTLMCEAGMKPMDALMASTKVAADCMGWDEKLGTIESGKLADIIITKTNPLTNISSLEDPNNIVMVIKDGEVVKDLQREQSMQFA